MITIKTTRIPEPRALHVAIGRASERSMRLIERDLKTVALRGTRVPAGLFRGGGSGNTLAVDTGALRASIVARTFRVDNRYVSVIGSDLVYAAVHEYGATIRGRPYLRIPTVYAKPYGNLPSFVQRSRRGNLFVFASVGKRGKIVPTYMLVPSVTLRARHMFRHSWERNQGAVRSEFASVLARFRTVQ